MFYFILFYFILFYFILFYFICAREHLCDNSRFIYNVMDADVFIRRLLEANVSKEGYVNIKKMIL